ncbi:hypothetical protein J7U46_22310 [Pelomonas sp. V22]|nr:hypothetical protein [Pelomonas sp. V22]
MRRVYLLSKDLEANPGQVERARALTLNRSKPRLGLRGVHGLFASDEWWNSINTGKMRLRFVSGIVAEAYEAGQDRTGVNNAVTVKLDDASTTSVGIYTNDPRDVRLFRTGSKVSIVYAQDELKDQPAPDGDVNYAEIALEMLVGAATNAA